MLPFEILREKKTGKLDERNNPIVEWLVVHELSGLMDMITGSDEQTYQNSLIATSQQVLISEDVSFPILTTDRIRNPRTGVEFEITFVDDPMELEHHLEIYCKRWT
ncbi:hypothetical protein IGI67_004532 [Enterococcus sp. AZ196]